MEGQRKEFGGGTSGEEDAWSGCALSAGAGCGRSPGRLSHCRERAQPAAGLAALAQAGLGPLGGQQTAGQASR